jgi:hypothetical protein
MTDQTDTTDQGGTRSSRKGGTKLKSLAIIVATLIIGMVLGGLITARLVNKRLDHITALRSQRGFTHFIERSIEYESEEQREQVAEILDRTARQMFEHLRASRETTMRLLDSTRADLSEVLSEEQMEQLERRLKRRGRRDQEMRRRRHRPPTDDSP